MAKEPVPPPEELILAMLREVLARQAQQMGLARRSEPPAGTPEPAQSASLASASPPVSEPPRPAQRSRGGQAEAGAEHMPPLPPPIAPTYLDEAVERLSPAEAHELAEFAEVSARPLLPSNLTRTLAWFAAGLIALLVLINLPIFSGLALARALPDRQALIFRDGLLLKGSGPEVYVLENNQRRWISSLDAFDHYGYSWDDVQVVEDAILADFPEGRPIHVLLKCDASPHIYRLENDRKRWIVDIPTFEAEGHVWEDVQFVSCQHLRSIPNGRPIPPDAGPPPEP